MASVGTDQPLAGVTRRRLLRWTAAAGLVAGLPARGEDTLKIGIALVSPVAEVGWTKQHSLAARAMEQALGTRVEVNIIDNVFQPQDAERVFRGFAASGHRLVFGTSFSHFAPLARVAPAVSRHRLRELRRAQAAGQSGFVRGALLRRCLHRRDRRRHDVANRAGWASSAAFRFPTSSARPTPFYSAPRASIRWRHAL